MSLLNLPQALVWIASKQEEILDQDAITALMDSLESLPGKSEPSIVQGLARFALPRTITNIDEPGWDR